MSKLRSTLNDLASNFADSVLAAIRTASLDDLVDESESAPRRGPDRPRGMTTKAPSSLARSSTPATAKFKGGRLARRSPEDIARTLGLVIAALKGSKGNGMRAEQLREFLAIDKRELPRVLGEGLKTRKLKSKGRKRATTYFAT